MMTSPKIRYAEKLRKNAEDIIPEDADMHLMEFGNTQRHFPPTELDPGPIIILNVRPGNSATFLTGLLS